jgi:hypothetical protein
MENIGKNSLNKVRWVKWIKVDEEGGVFPRVGGRMPILT